MTKVNLVSTDVEVTGKFQFSLRGKEKIKKSKLTNIDSFVPIGKKQEDRLRFLSENGEIDTLFIGAPIVIFKPDESEIDRHNVKVLIQHFDVFLPDVPEAEWQKMVQKKIKKSNPKFSLVNVDKKNIEKFENEQILVKTRASLYNDSMTLERLKWLCSVLGVGYRSSTTDTERLKVEYITKLDKFLQYSKENIAKFNEFVNNIKRTEGLYYINLFMEKGLVKEFGSIYKVGDVPVGSNKDEVIQYFQENIELFQNYKKLALESEN